MEKEIIRTATCWTCIYCGNSDGGPFGKPKKSFCEVTKRWGNLIRGNYCEKYDFKQWGKGFADDGIPIQNRQEMDYRTENQWNMKGRKIKKDVIGTKMHSNRNNLKTVYICYLIDETEEK